MIPRRGLLAGLGALLAAPAIIRTPGLLMPVRPLREPLWFGVDWGTEPNPFIRYEQVMTRAEFDATYALITGVNEKMLLVSSRERTAVTVETQRQEGFLKLAAGTIKFRG